MGSKNPPIQVLMADFADENRDKLLYIEEHDAYYWLDSEKHYYKPLSSKELTRKLAKFLEPLLDGSITSAVFTNALLWLNVKIKTRLETVSSNKAIFKDGTTLDLKTLEVGTYNKKTDKIFFYINCKFPSKKSTCPNFLAFLQQIIVHPENNKPDKEMLQMIQEMFGYYLLSTQEPPVAFFLLGGGSNGKSTLMLVLEQLVGGEQFIMSNSLENLTGKDFHAQELRFKRLNICSEEQSKFIKSGNFKTLTEGARMHAEIKFGDQISIMPKTKHIFLTNKMPKFDIVDYATKRRMFIVPFNRQFMPNETDKQLKTKVFKDSKFGKELPAIIAWAIVGAKRLIENNYVFTLPQQVVDAFKAYEKDVSSTLDFFHENFAYNGPDNTNAEFYGIDRLYRIYKAWCQQSTRKPVSANNFRSDIKQETRLKEFVVGWDKCMETQSCRGLKLELNREATILDPMFNYLFKKYNERIAEEDIDE